MESIHYRVSGSGSPQAYLAPYYLKLDNDDGSIAAASSRSILPSIMGRVSGSALELSAEVTGSPGPFEYTWALWRPDAAQTDTNPVTGPTFLLTQPGFYNVVLDIRDLSTQDVTRIQRLVVLPMRALG